MKRLLVVLGFTTLATVVLLGVVQLPRAEGLALAPHVYCAVGRHPVSIAVADLNRDGKQDLATADNHDDSVSVLLKRPGVPPGALQFASYASYAAGYFADGVAVGDFNRDGWPDLATASHNDCSLGILLGSGGGALGSMTSYSTTHYFPYSVAVGDFNRDGKQDLVTETDLSPGYVNVWLGVGDGTFGTNSNLRVRGHPSFVAIGDFNGDGKMTASVTSGEVSVLSGNGDGTFATRVNYTTGGGSTRSPLATSIATARRTW